MATIFLKGVGVGLVWEWEVGVNTPLPLPFPDDTAQKICPQIVSCQRRKEAFLFVFQRT